MYQKPKSVRKSTCSKSTDLQVIINPSTRKRPVASQQKLKTSTPSRSRIDDYMSPGADISRIPQPQRSALERRSALDSESGTENSTDGQRSSQSGDATNKEKHVTKLVQRRPTRKTKEKRDANLKKSVERMYSSEKTGNEGMISRRIKHQKLSKSNKSGYSDQSNSSISTRSSKNTSALKNATIDKFMSPDRSSSVISTPTRFHRRSTTDFLSDEAVSLDTDRDDEVETMRKSKKSQMQTTQTKPSDKSTSKNILSRTSTNVTEASRSQELRSAEFSSLSVEDEESTSRGIQQLHDDSRSNQTTGKAKSKGVKRKSSDSLPTKTSKKQKGLDRDSIDDDYDDGIVSIDGEASIRKKKAKVSSRFMASGDVETHMADKEFLANQVRTLSKPFSMDAGPRQWIDIWKAKQLASDESDESDTDEIHEKVIHKAMSKLNHAMNRELGCLLGLPQQRKVLIKLDEIHKEKKQDREEGDCFEDRSALRTGASLDEILEHYPSEWPGADSEEEFTSEQDRNMADRYAEVHSRLLDVSHSLTIKEQQHKHLQNLRDQLKEIDRNLRSCTDDDFKQELNRTDSLVSQILKKLKQRRSPRKQMPSSKQGEKPTKGIYRTFIESNETLVRHLFTSTV